MKYLYWGATIALALFMGTVGTFYFISEGFAETFARLGFPDFIRVELGIAKILGAIALVAPVPRWIKEWTYAGFTITFVSAFFAHLTAGDPASALVMPVVSFVLLVTSYVTYHRYYRGTEDETATAPDATTA